MQRLLKDSLPSVLKAYAEGREWINDRDPYRPYHGIPDTPRNRLLTFIARWSLKQLAFDKGQREKEPGSSEMLDDRCLVKWETSDPDNHQGREVLRVARELVQIANGGKSPTVLDPFSGGGAIPLEATRLGCQAIANDYNPVAYLILRAACEFPQRYGKKLAQDVEHWAEWILDRARQRIGHLYPPGKDGKPVVGYIWVRTVPCSNPACRAEIPLLRNLLICDKSGKRVALTMASKGKNAIFSIARGRDIKETEGTMLKGGDCRCPACKQITTVKDVRRAGQAGKLGERILAVITDTPHGKGFRCIEETDLASLARAVELAKEVERPGEFIVPEINGPQASPNAGSHRSISIELYGFKTFASLFNPRQLLAMQTFVACTREALDEASKQGRSKDEQLALAANLGLWLGRVADRMTTFVQWQTTADKFGHMFKQQSLAVIWDYAEVNPFNEVSGGAQGQLGWIPRFIKHETPPEGLLLAPVRVYCGDGAHLPLADHTADSVVTDPPYFDSMAYADLSDFFYMWLKRAVGHLYPLAFATPQTPKSEEAVAHKHRHEGNKERGKQHFEKKLAECLAEAKRVCKPNGVLAVMFAHQSTEAWTALITALFRAGLNITATYPIDTERGSRMIAMGVSALASSITVICRPRQAGGAASFKDVRKEIEQVVAEAVHRFFDVYGFRGADLIVACYGPAVGVFGRYERVERADGTPVDVPTLLELAKEAALKAIAGEFTGDVQSRLYYVWSNLYGTSEQAWDDARLVVQVGGNSEDAMEIARQRGLFVVHGSTCRLALLKDRTDMKHLGDAADASLVDQLHHALRLWKAENRDELVDYLAEHELADHGPFWKLAQALFEVLPRDIEDWKLISALLGERETLRTQAKRSRLL